MSDNTLKLNLDPDLNLIVMQNPTQRILEISLQAPVATSQTRLPSINLALVLDRSGSMAGDKIKFVKSAASQIIELLREEDHMALVAYDDTVNVLAPSRRITGSSRSELQNQVSMIRPGGMTNLDGGWLAGCKEVANAAQPGSLNRTLLLTDGLANVGETDLEVLSRRARELAQRGVTTSTFGVGDGYNEHLLEAMSNQGDGNFYFIDNPERTREFFQREFGELSKVTAREIEISFVAPPGLELQILGGWRFELSEGNLRIHLSTLYSGQIQKIYLRMTSPSVAEGDELILKAHLLARGEADQLYEDQVECSFKSAGLDTVNAAPRNRELLGRFALVYLADTATEALKLERLGKNREASDLLNKAIQEYQDLVDPFKLEEYKHLSERMKHRMSEFDRKTAQYSSYQQRRGKP